MPFLQRKLAHTVSKWLDEGTVQPPLVRGARRTGKTALAETIGREFCDYALASQLARPRDATHT